jgi:hypothetical protein
LDTPYLSQDFVIEFTLEEDDRDIVKYSQCEYRSNQTKVLICQIPYFEDVGSYNIRFSCDNGTIFRPANQKFRVEEDPIITDISPRVFLKHTEYQIRIYGRNFDPQFIKAVWVGKFRLSYQ